MIETTVNIVPNKEVISYPCLAKSKSDNSVIVLFSGPTVGTVLASDGKYGVGYYDEDWLPLYSDNWIILPPESSVILRNK